MVVLMPRVLPFLRRTAAQRRLTRYCAQHLLLLVVRLIGRSCQGASALAVRFLRIAAHFVSNFPGALSAAAVFVPQPAQHDGAGVPCSESDPHLTFAIQIFSSSSCGEKTSMPEP